MTSKEWTAEVDRGGVQDALKSGLVSKMVMDVINDLSVCEIERDAWKVSFNTEHHLRELDLKDVAMLSEAAREAEDKIEGLKAQLARCREALDLAEWGCSEGEWNFCPLCGSRQDAGHSKLCEIGIALSTTEGDKT